MISKSKPRTEGRPDGLTIGQKTNVAATAVAAVRSNSLRLRLVLFDPIVVVAITTGSAYGIDGYLQTVE